MARKSSSTGKTRRRSRDESALRKRSRYLDGVTEIDIDDTEFLSKFVTEHGKIIPARLTGATAAQQRRIKAGIRRARNIGLIA